MKSVKIFSTFTGIGSVEMALRNINVPYESVGISEVDRYALAAFDAIHGDTSQEVLCPPKEEILAEIALKNIAYNFSTNKSEVPKGKAELESLYAAHKRSNNFGDIRKIDEQELPDFDLFTYSFPCKNISVAGRQAGLVKGSDTQSSLLWECERIIKHKLPTYLLMENVKNLVGKNHIGDFESWIECLDLLGYNSYWKVLNGRDFGVPQNRERVMMVSIRKEQDSGDFEMPEGFPLTTHLKDVIDPEVDEKYYIKPHRYAHITQNLPSQEVSYCIDDNYHKGASVDGYIAKRRRQLIQVGALDGKMHANCRIYSAEGISPTLNSMNGGNRQPKILEHSRVRKLTPIECWRVMGYSDGDFLKAEGSGLSNTKLYERAGRGIVVPMLESILKEVFHV